MTQMALVIHEHWQSLGSTTLMLTQNGSCFVRRARTRLAAACDIKHPSVLSPSCRPQFISIHAGCRPGLLALPDAAWLWTHKLGCLVAGDTLPLKIRTSWCLHTEKGSKAHWNAVAYLNVSGSQADNRQTVSNLKTWFTRQLFPCNSVPSEKRPFLQFWLTWKKQHISADTKAYRWPRGSWCLHNRTKPFRFLPWAGAATASTEPQLCKRHGKKSFPMGGSSLPDVLLLSSPAAERCRLLFSTSFGQQAQRCKAIGKKLLRTWSWRGFCSTKKPPSKSCCHVLCFLLI